MENLNLVWRAVDELEDTKGTKKLSKERNHFHNHQPANCAKLSASSRAVLVSPTLCLQLQSNGSALSLKSSVGRVAGRTPEGDRGYFLSKKDKLDKKEKTLVGRRAKKGQCTMGSGGGGSLRFHISVSNYCPEETQNGPLNNGRVKSVTVRSASSSPAWRTTKESRCRAANTV